MGTGVEIDKIGGELSGLRKLLQDLVTPQLSVVQSTVTAQGKEIPAVEARLMEQFSLIRADMNKGFEAARQDSDRSLNEIKLFIRAESAERDRDLYRKRVEELERQHSA